MLLSKQRKKPAKNVILVGEFYSNPVFTFESVGVRKFSRLPLLNYVGSNKKVIRGVVSPVTVTGGLTRWKIYVIIMAHTKAARLSHYSIARKLNIHATLKIV